MKNSACGCITRSSVSAPSLDRILKGRAAVARLIITFPEREDQLMLLFDRLEMELQAKDKKEIKLKKVRQLATSATSRSSDQIWSSLGPSP